MTKTKFWLSILAISVVLVAGSLAVSPIAIADDDDEEDDDKDDDKRKRPKEVIVANTEPIPVTASPSNHPAVQFEVNGVQVASCDAINTSSFTVRTDAEGFVIYSGSITGVVHSVVVTEDAFELEGIYTGINQSCIDDLRNFPALFSVNGDCGLGSAITVRTEGGVEVSFTGDVACIP